MPESRRVRILLAGYGTIGRAFHETVASHRARYRAEHALDLDVVGVARRDRYAMDPKGLQPSTNGLAWKNGNLFDIIADVGADVLVEATPSNLKTGQPALGHVRAAIHEGIPVVLANKGPLVAAYKDITERAAKAHVPLRFEATVAAGVPVLNAARVAFAGDRIQRVQGILNGTTNFILTRMSDEGSDLEQALKEAQALGYAETDPSADLDGLDAAAKVVILGNALLGLDLTLDKVNIQGIRSVTRQAVEVASANGFRIKLVGEADRDGHASVGLRLVKRGSSLDVGGVLNAVRFTNDLSGAITHVGRGAGARPTVSALLGDVIDLFRPAWVPKRVVSGEAP